MAGKLVIFSAPSGAGKTSIVRALLSEIPSLAFSISACSRPMRPGEQNGVDYYFLSPEAFREKIELGEFLEWEEVYPGSFYGTLKSEVERIRSSGRDVIFDVDVAGALNIKKQYKEQALAVFVKPPSVEELKKRLILRKTETEESLNKRIGKAKKEMSFAGQFDREVINDRLEDAIQKAVQMVKAFLDLPHNKMA
ncbi:MAG: guanylate kinase [Bacteroidales bacterium]